jgi:hypothetical protein
VRARGAVLAVEGIEPIATPVHHLLDDGSFAQECSGIGRRRPLGLDRYGVRLRVENEVDDVTGLSQAIRVLMGCPFLYGIRARRR